MALCCQEQNYNRSSSRLVQAVASDDGCAYRVVFFGHKVHEWKAGALHMER